MSHRNVEGVIGRLVTDEGFRRRFSTAPRAALQDIIDQGVQLNECELQALVAIDPRQLERFVETLHPSIQKAELQGGRS
ncbi:MAG: Os1348 family NHLP clan protein [Acidobacteriota bacterium]